MTADKYADVFRAAGCPGLHPRAVALSASASWFLRPSGFLCTCCGVDCLEGTLPPKAAAPESPPTAGRAGAQSGVSLRGQSRRGDISLDPRLEPHDGHPFEMLFGVEADQGERPAVEGMGGIDDLDRVHGKVGEGNAVTYGCILFGVSSTSRQA